MYIPLEIFVLGYNKMLEFILKIWNAKFVSESMGIIQINYVEIVLITCMKLMRLTIKRN